MKQVEQTPYRYRHDGWTPTRQAAFLEALKAGGSVTEACRHVELSRNSAMRAKWRIPEFGSAWDLALAFSEPALERAAYLRGVEGWLEPVLYKGEVVAHRRRYSDAMLTLLLARAQVAAQKRPLPTDATREETNAALVKAFAAAARRIKVKQRAEAITRADDVVVRGLAP